MGNAKTSEKNGLRGWIAQWGFSILVGLAALVGAYVAWRVSVPAQVPDFALKAAPVYRIEIGAAVFLALYLVAMAFVLALNNRGFSEIGVNGLKAQDMANKAQQDAIQGHQESLDILEALIDSLENSTEKSIQELEMRLEDMEKIHSTEPSTS
jgi:hypothetical protein